MSDKKVRLDVTQINDRQGIEQLQRELEALDSVVIHELGLNEVHLTHDRNSVTSDDLTRAVEKAGGHLQRIHPES